MVAWTPGYLVSRGLEPIEGAGVAYAVRMPSIESHCTTPRAKFFLHEQKCLSVVSCIKNLEFRVSRNGVVRMESWIGLESPMIFAREGRVCQLWSVSGYLGIMDGGVWCQD